MHVSNPLLLAMLLGGSVSSVLAFQAPPSAEPAVAKNPDTPATVDIGQQSIGKLNVSLIYGTDGDPAKAGKELTAPHKTQLAALNKLSKIKFKHYRLIGKDQKSILRSYENWATPLHGSKEILLSFQPRGEAVNGSLILDVEFWQSHKKIMKGGIRLEHSKPLYIQGPDWRGGKIIIVVELASLKGFDKPEQKK